MHRSTVGSLAYVVELAAVVVMTEDGQILFMPYVPHVSRQSGFRVLALV
jgi:hypothetical protein